MASDSDMSILSRNNKMGTPMFHEFKKQASFFFREKIKIARLALTDVTPVQLMTEEATGENPCAPDSRILSSISRAAFELDDYCRIVEILHKRFASFDKKNWRVSYNSLIVLEQLLTHGPESVAKEFQDDVEVFNDMGGFQYIDEKGFNWGLAVRKKSERVVKLLEMGPLLKEERDRARRVSRGIQGFGSFCDRSSSSSETKALALRESSMEAYRRCNSQYNESLENQVNGGDSNQIDGKIKKMERLKSLCSLGESDVVVKYEGQASLKENMDPEESKSLLSGGGEDECGGESLVEEEHPFNGSEKQTCASLLPTGDGLLLGY